MELPGLMPSLELNASDCCSLPGFPRSSLPWPQTGQNGCLDRSFLDTHKVDLYIPGNPAHPLTIINGLLSLTGR